MTGNPRLAEIFYDIRKLYQFRAPAPELREYIEFFSETSIEATRNFINTDKFTVTLFPSFTPTIWINLGSPYSLSNGIKTEQIDKNSDVLVLRCTVLERNNFSTDNIFTIKFSPLGFESIFGVSQARIGNGVVSASEILPDSVIRKLKQPIGLEAKSHFLDNFFFGKLYKNSAGQFHLRCVKQAIDLFLDSNMDVRLSEIASDLHISEKTFNRYFHQIVGTNPKYFFSMVRCRLALSRYTQCSGQFSPHDFGYYDFSHFSKEIKRFTGANLTSFLQSP